MITEVTLDFDVTTQGPLYPPSEIMDVEGNFLVVGLILRRAPDGTIKKEWGRAIVSPTSEVPPLGDALPYSIKRELAEPLSEIDAGQILYTLPVPLPCNNYDMVFAPEQCPRATLLSRPSYPLHDVPIPDARYEDGRKVTAPIALGDWLDARGTVTTRLTKDRTAAKFDCSCSRLVPNSMYTVMSLRERDLDPNCPTRPGPLGIPNVFITDDLGNGFYSAELPNPFEKKSTTSNRVVSIVVLMMSYQMNYGGAIGLVGLGGDIHAHLKLAKPSFMELETSL